MLDNSQNPTQSDKVGKESQRSRGLPILERSLLFVVGFFAYFVAFRFGRDFVEWQFGLTIILSAVLGIAVPALYVENKRLTNQLSNGHFCILCYIGGIGLAGLAMIPVFFAWIGGTITYKLIAPLVLFVIFFVPILYLENERVTSQLSEEITEPRTFKHALTFVALAIIVGGLGWTGGTAMRAFIETAVPKVTLL